MNFFRRHILASDSVIRIDLKCWLLIRQCCGSGAFLTPGSGMCKKSGSGSGMNNPDHISVSLETIFWVKILKFFDAGSGSVIRDEKIRIRIELLSQC